MSFGRTSLGHLLTQVVTSVAGFLATFVIARYLGAGVLGTFVQATALVAVITIPTKAVGGATNKRISERQHPEEFFTAGLGLVLGTVGLLAAGLWIARPLLVRFIGAPVVALVILYVTANAVFNFYTAVLTGEKKVIASGGLDAIEQGSRFAFQFALILLGYEIGGLLFGQVLSLLVATSVGLLVSDLSIRLPTYGHFRRLVDFAKYTWMNQIKGRSFSWMDVLILGAFVQSSYVGIYEVSWTLASVLILVSLSIKQTLFPEFSELGVQENYDRVRHLLDEGLAFVGIFAIPGFFGSLVVGADLLSIYRPVFRQGEPVLLLLVIARLLDAYASQFLSALGALDVPEYVFRIGLVFTVLNLGLNVVLIWSLGWVGAAVATGTAALVEMALGYHYLSRVMGGVDLPFGTLTAEVASAVVMAGLLAVAARFVQVTNVTVVLLVLLGACVYGAVLFALSPRVRGKARMLAGGCGYVH